MVLRVVIDQWHLPRLTLGSMRMATVEHESCQEYYYVTATKKDRLIPKHQLEPRASSSYPNAKLDFH